MVPSALLLVTAALLSCCSLVTGATYVNGSGVVHPTAITLVNVFPIYQGERYCQAVYVPLGGIKLNSFAMGIDSAGTSSTDLIVSARSATFQYFNTSVDIRSTTRNQVSLLPLGFEYFIPSGTSYICVGVDWGSLAVMMVGNTATRRYTINSDDTLNPGIVDQSMAYFFYGEEQGIWEFPYSENFDSFSRCTGVCPLNPGGNSSCPMKRGWSTPPNGTGSAGDTNWLTYSGPTPTHADTGITGPANDHTLGNATGNYIYMESSGLCSPGKSAHLLTPIIVAPMQWVAMVEFWVTMYSRHGGNAQLHFDASFDGGLTWVLDTHTMLQGNYSANWFKVTLDYSWPMRAYVREGRGMIIRFRAVSSTILDTFEESDISIDDFHITEATMTTSLTATQTFSQSSTQTATVVPTMTSTPTVVPTMTATSTETLTAYNQYQRVGIVDPDVKLTKIDEEGIVNNQWMNVLQQTLIAGDDAVLALTGFWMYSVGYPTIKVKLAAWSQNCYAEAAGSDIVYLDNQNLARIKAPIKVGQYRLCIMHRQDWEEVRNTLITVIPPQVNATFYGYSTCASFVQAQGANFTNLCGCFYQKGTGGGFTVSLPDNYPIFQLGKDDRPGLFQQGCCVRSTKQRYTFPVVNATVTSQWGFCTDYDAPVIPVTSFP